MNQESALTQRSRVVQALGKIDEASRALVPPIHVSSTYIRDADNGYRSGNVYGRADNETVRDAEAIVAMLEQGADALLFGSGMAAATACFLSLRPGDHVVVPNVMYWALRSWLIDDATRWGLCVEFVDMTDVDAVRSAVRPGETKLVWAETPANPLWSITDIATVAEIAHSAGAILAVDSTCATPILSQPLLLGADLVMHAATKYLNGHSDVLAGALACARADETWERIQRVRKLGGAILGPFETFLLIRGMRTLDLRVRTACTSALRIAHDLESHPDVIEVLYPGLESSSGYAVACRQMNGGFGGMLSVRVRGGEAAAIATAAKVALWKRATSLGGVESLIEHRASIEGPSTPCPTDLLRLSTGIEDPEDLLADLSSAISAARG